MSRPRQAIKLEPMQRFLVLAVLGHLLLAALVWWWIQIQRFSAPRVLDVAQVSWMETADVTTTIIETPKATTEVPPTNEAPSPVPSLPPIVVRSQAATIGPTTDEKPVPKAILIRPPDKPVPSAATTPAITSRAPVQEVSRFVTVSRLAATSAQQIKEMEAVDRALIEAFLAQWTPPKRSAAGQRQQAVLLEVALDRAGKLASFKMSQPSGDSAVDASVLEAAHRLEKVGESLPSTFVGERYSVQVRFHVE
jgi:TonB family protein